MKKQLTKQEIEKRKIIINKVKNITLYVSLAFNVLIAVCIGISACSSKSIRSTSNNTNDFNKQLVKRNDRQYAFSDYNPSNDDVLVYSTGFNHKTPDKSYYQYSYINLRDNNISVTSSTGVDTSSITVMELFARIYKEHPNDEYYLASHTLEFRTADNTVVYGYAWRFDGTTWSTNGTPITDIPIWYMSFTKQFLSNDSIADFIINYYYPLTDYKDFNLADNWGIQAYFSNTSYGIWTGDNHPTNPFYLIKNGAFSINGVFYTDLCPSFMTVPASGNVRDYHVYYDNVNYIVVDKTTSVTVCFGLEARNRFNNQRIYVLSYPRAFMIKDENTIDIYPFEINFANYQLANIRQYDVNLSETSDATPYINGNVLSVEANYQTFTGSSSGDIDNAFDLFTNAFNGFANIFGITILPGITIGLLIFIPLVATIVFAVLKVLKK